MQGYPNDNEEDNEMKDLFCTFIILCLVVFCGFYLEKIHNEDVKQLTKPEVVKNDEGSKSGNN